MPFGPRLDRPSAVGDEGRPRETSLGILAVTVVGLAIATGVVLGHPMSLFGFALITGVTTAGVALLDRDTLGEKVVGHLCFLPGAMVLAMLVVLSSDRDPLLTAGFVLALLGTASSWADVAADKPLESTLSQGILSYVFGLCWLFGGAIAIAAVYLCWQFATGVSSAGNPTVATIGFLVLVGLVLGSVRVALGKIPVLQLTLRDRREEVRGQVARAKRRLAVGALLSLGCGLVSLLFLVKPSPAVGLVPGAPLVVDGLTSIFVLGPLLAVGAASLLVAGLVVGARQVTQQFDEQKTRTVAAGIAGAGYLAVLLFGLVPQIATLLIFAPVVFVMFVLLAPLGVFVVVGLALLAVRIDVFPDRAGGPALAGAGLVVAAIGMDSAALPAVLVFATVAGALVAWDAGSFGLGITAELGHRPSTRRLELYHGVFAVGIGTVAVAGATALYAVRTTTLGTTGNTVAMAVAVVGTLLLGALLRG